MEFDRINSLLQEIAEQLNTIQIEINTEKYLEEIDLTWVNEMQNLYASYSHSE